ncbi:unnamed protein product [Discosporangium mesarthrocarpum]
MCIVYLLRVSVHEVSFTCIRSGIIFHVYPSIKYILRVSMYLLCVSIRETLLLQSASIIDLQPSVVDQPDRVFLSQNSPSPRGGQNLLKMRAHWRRRTGS